MNHRHPLVYLVLALLLIPCSKISGQQSTAIASLLPDTHIGTSNSFRPIRRFQSVTTAGLTKHLGIMYAIPVGDSEQAVRNYYQPQIARYTANRRVGVIITSVGMSAAGVGLGFMWASVIVDASNPENRGSWHTSLWLTGGAVFLASVPVMIVGAVIWANSHRKLTFLRRQMRARK